MYNIRVNGLNQGINYIRLYKSGHIFLERKMLNEKLFLAWSNENQSWRLGLVVSCDT